MTSARVIAGLGVSSEWLANTLDRAAPPPNVTQRSQAVVACVHGATARAFG
jgi:hypothetical protein